jgi:hypothetical protein
MAERTIDVTLDKVWMALDQSIFNNRDHVYWEFLGVVFTDILKHNPEYIEYIEER